MLVLVSAIPTLYDPSDVKMVSVSLSRLYSRPSVRSPSDTQWLRPAWFTKPSWISRLRVALMKLSTAGASVGFARRTPLRATPGGGVRFVLPVGTSRSLSQVRVTAEPRFDAVTKVLRDPAALMPSVIKRAIVLGLPAPVIAISVSVNPPVRL